MNQDGSYFVSRFKSSTCRKFGKEQRDVFDRLDQNKTPGPGSYRSPSEFGYYSAQDKFVKETEKEPRNVKSYQVTRNQTRIQSANFPRRASFNA